MVCMVVAEEDGIAMAKPFFGILVNLQLDFLILVVVVQRQAAVNKDSGIGCHKFHAVPTNLVGSTMDDELEVVWIICHFFRNYSKLNFISIDFGHATGS